MQDAAAPLLSMKGICKKFPGVTALDEVDFDLRAGEVHLLMGENGAGKSTLMKILSGAYPKDKGTIEIAGEKREIRSPHHAQRIGITMIYQEMNLVPHLSVAANIFLGREETRAGFLKSLAMERDAAVLLSRLHADFPPSAIVARLSVAQQQLVEISKALSLKARIVVMDEPTSPLARHEVEDLFRIIRELKETGVAIIYITHRLEEGRAIGDRVTVLRDGRLIASRPLSQTPDAELVRMMVGRELSGQFPPVPEPREEMILEAENLKRKGVFGPVTFGLKAGEILGFAGLMGSGRTELARCLVGADESTGGTVKVSGTLHSFRSPRQARQSGVCLLPEDRKGQGLILGLPLLHNASLAALKRFVTFGFLRPRAERNVIGALISRLRINPPDVDREVKYLSGGNQQKVVLAKWLAAEPRVIIFDEPTRGIDVGAKFEVYQIIAGLAAEGAGIILISSELSEVLGLSHRVAVMHDGKLAAVLPRAEATPEKVMSAAMGMAAA